MDLVDLAERAWRGEDAEQALRPLGPGGDLTTITEGVAFLPNFANCTVFDTGEGLVLNDTGSPFTAQRLFDQVRDWSDKALSIAIYSHGHIDHVFGVGPFDAEADAKGWPRPRVVAHENVPRRFARYVMTAGYNQAINRRQFGADTLEWPLEYRYPDVTYREEYELIVGGSVFRLRHELGETDDATVTFHPDSGVLCTGDLFIWNSPNAGNPQKVQRYPREWAEALRRMDGLNAEFLLPGHGLPIYGRARVHQALSETAEYLESLVDQTLSLMNEGARLADVLASVRVPAHLEGRPYLRPFYDEPEFIVRNLWRLYGGWWDGNPANLRPAHERRLAAELADVAGGADRLAARARVLAEAGSDEDLRTAGHLAEMARLAAPDDPRVREAHQDVYRRLSESATSTMSRGVFRYAQRESSAD